ncbi:hypothetical protein B6K85_05885 [Vibrio sp. V1B]|uniref:hypothetical protein n=1 Tax=Vibrio harveyi group TaxID=717610 RepID=UPI00039C8BF2|nr:MULTISPECIES: hypothetical protein [Vibrio harveyi group]PAW11655.1 hypothetical protein B6K85_05885 [Vibrio sp. V1B]
MKLLADKTGEQFLQILDEQADALTVQFISNEGEPKGQPFKDSLKGLKLAGWSHRTTSTAIGLSRFKKGYLEDAHVSFALHRLYPLGRKIKLPSGEIVQIASYANTHANGYYMFVRRDDEQELVRMKMSPDWLLMPSEKLLALPYYPRPRTQQELNVIDDFDKWAGGF